MNWARAKNLCLIFLILLNVFLFIMINISGDKYKLDNTSVNAIQNLLLKNNIKCEKMMVKFYPKKQLILSNSEVDKDKLAKIFFKGENFSYENNCIFNEQKRLKLLNNGFECEFFKTKQYDNDKKIKEICNLIVKKIKDPDTNFVLDKEKLDEIVEYRQKFHSMIIIDNFVRFEILDGCIKKIVYEYSPVANFFGTSYEIKSPDVILFEFMKNDDVVKKNGVKINKFDLTYKIMEENLGYLFAIPCYRFIYDNNFEILFDAYSGKVCT